MMTLQEVYDRVRDHLLTQMVCSYDEEIDLSLFRGPDNTCCAIGCLIPDELYTPEMERGNMFNRLVLEALQKGGVNTDSATLKLLNSLANVHDYLTPSVWRLYLDQIAEQMGFLIKNNV